MSDEDTQDAAFGLMVASGAATVVMASALLYVMTKTGGNKSESIKEAKEEAPIELDRQKYPGGHLSIYFASQTGTAESFANQLQREGAEHGFFVYVIDLEDVEVEDLMDEARRDETGSKAIFLCSTYGEGEPTDNAAQFVTEIKNRTEGAEEEKKEESSPTGDKCLTGLDYCVFGLGNRQYEHYNAMGRLFDECLEKIGARRVATIGLGDDDDDLEGDFETWKDGVLWPTLKKLYVKEAIVSTNKEAIEELPDTPYAVEYVSPSKPAEIALDDVHSSSRYYFSSVDCPVKVVKELRSKDADGSTVHVEIDISPANGFIYQTADNLGVLPENDATVVAAVADALSYDLDAHFAVKSNPKHEWHGAPFPNPITVRECLSRYCDLTGSPRRSDLKLLASYATDPVDKKALLRMSSKEGRAEYKEKIVQSHVGLVDLLKLCPSIQAPLEHFLNFCPRMVPRYYTISSSSSVHPQTIHLTVSVTETLKKDGSVYKGICSSYLAGSKDRTLRIFDRESGFRLPPDTTKPILMIGPGTGVAPMRALLQEREYQRKRQKKDVGANVLYFGCQNRKKDYIYQEELDAYQKAGVLSDLQVAFSREQADKVYVQHLLSKRAKDTWSLIEQQGAFIYVCGGLKMGHDVQETLISIIATEGSRSSQDAKSYLDQLGKDGRYVQELWA